MVTAMRVRREELGCERATDSLAVAKMPPFQRVERGLLRVT
jgi:hypothetical protein